VDEPIALRPGESNPVKADRPELSLLEITFDPGSGVDPHFHKAPPNVVHWFTNTGETPARMLNLHTPGGFVQYRRELRDLRANGIEPDVAFFERHDVFDV
jgi:hypothetical protein